MKTNQIITAILFLLISTHVVVAQSSIEEIVREGIQYHDQGEFDKAIETYEKGLKIDPRSPLVNYELALSHLSNGDYEKAIEYSDVVLSQKKGHMLPAYITKGSALDMLGKTKESIKLLEKAVKKTEGHYLLYYNLALDYYKIDNLAEAEETVVKAIELQLNHSSSHLMLANIHNQKGNAIQALLATHFFLFLEPNSARSEEAYLMLQKHFNGNVSTDEDGNNKITIRLSSDSDSPFGAAEMMVSMLAASKSLDENKGKTDDEMFIENTDAFFKILGELNKKKYKDIWWTFYIPFFYDLAQSEYLETYCKYITQSGNENSRKWLAEHEDELTDFDEWLQDR